MDSITQGVLGASVAQFGFEKKLGPKSLWFGTLCGLAPDFDVISRVFGEWESLIHHRGITHSIIALPFLAIPMAWLGWRYFGQKKNPKLWYFLAFWALITHPLLDLFTSYGTQLFFPFNNYRYSIDAIAIVDPFYTFPLILALLYRKTKFFNLKTSKLLSGLALFWGCIYISFGYIQNQKVISKSILFFNKNDISIKRIKVTPYLFNVFIWRSLVKDSNGNLYLGIISTLKDKTKPEFKLIAKKPGPLIKKALETREGKVFNWFAMEYLSYETKILEDYSLVVLKDQRYGKLANPQKSIFKANFKFDKNQKLIKAWRPLPKRDLNISVELEAFKKIIY